MEALCTTLRTHGYETEGFSDGHAALQALATAKFDLLLSDLMMPGMDGIELLTASLKIDPDLIGIIMTGEGTIDTAVGAMKAGAFDYILKPFRLRVTLPVLARALSVRNLRMENAGLERKLRRHVRELEAANQELEAFSRSVSHDLRAPILGIANYARTLLDQSEASASKLDRSVLLWIHDSAVNTGRLVDGLLELSQSGLQPLAQTRVSVSGLVQQVIANLRPECEGRQVDIQIGQLPDCIGDELLLRQVFANLLSNALKYTRRRTQAVVEVGFRQQADESIYFVRDNGAGFDMQYSAKLFGIFQRLHRARDFEGTGVGLSIVQRIVQRHGGRIWAEAAVDQGATFFFTLPAAPGN
jgi:hypothetical protein